MEDKTVIVVTPTRLFPVQTKGRLCECAKCHQEAWLSDTSIDAVEKGISVELVCVQCFVKVYEEAKITGEEIIIQKFTKDQIDEIKSKI